MYASDHVASIELYYEKIIVRIDNITKLINIREFKVDPLDVPVINQHLAAISSLSRRLHGHSIVAIDDLTEELISIKTRTPRML